jgi:hypothetical protein
MRRLDEDIQLARRLNDPGQEEWGRLAPLE